MICSPKFEKALFEHFIDGGADKIRGGDRLQEDRSASADSGDETYSPARPNSPTVMKPVSATAAAAATAAAVEDPLVIAKEYSLSYLDYAASPTGKKKFPTLYDQHVGLVAQNYSEVGHTGRCPSGL